MAKFGIHPTITLKLYGNRLNTSHDLKELMFCKPKILLDIAIIGKATCWPHRRVCTSYENDLSLSRCENIYGSPGAMTIMVELGDLSVCKISSSLDHPNRCYMALEFFIFRRHTFCGLQSNGE